MTLSDKTSQAALISGIAVPDSKLASEITEFIRDTESTLLFNHSSRVYYFGNEGKEEVYAGSADLMPRNLDRRVELLFPIINPKIVRYLRDVVLEKYLADNRKARIGKPDGTYETLRSGSLDSQAWFLSHRTSQAD